MPPYINGLRIYFAGVTMLGAIRRKVSGVFGVENGLTVAR